MLFLANNISKMKKNTVLGSRIVEVHNSSSLSTGKAGSGPSNLRQYIIEQDMLEAIVALPEEMFYNTPITTYIWVLTNKKDVKRKGKVQLIDATKIKTSLRKNLGNKKFEISKELRSKILDIYMGFDQADSKLSKIVDNSDFGYWEVPIMHPLYDENGKIVVETKGKNKGKPKADKDLTDKNRVQFSYAGGVEAFYSEEVKPYSPDAWIDWDNIKIGYDISFTKYFYDPEDLRDALDIVSDLNNIHSESTQTLEKIIEHAKGNDDSRKDAVMAYKTILDDLSILLKQDGITPEQQEKITDKMILVADKIADLHEDNRNFLEGIIKYGTPLIGGALLLGAVILGVNVKGTKLPTINGKK